MPRLSVREFSAPGIEVAMMSERAMVHESATALVPAPWDEPTETRHLRWSFATDRDEQLFEAAWFNDFRNRWRAALRSARLQFISRMEAL